MIIVLSALFLPGCASLPPRPDLPFEQASAPAETGPIAELTKKFLMNNGAQSSGARLLIDSKEAFEARLALVDLATGSIDLQYFIWKGDETGILLFERLLQAADRGVYIRLIIDDIWLDSTTENLAALNSHPNLELRIFNPNPSRDYVLGGFLHYLSSFQALNRRMHNKLMIVDNHALIAGGRNIGNEYFGLGSEFNFIDVDVLSVGEVVRESSNAFDHYWNHNAVYPVSGWNVIVPDNALEIMRLEVEELLDQHVSRLTSFPLNKVDWQPWLDRIEKELVPGSAHFLQDDPVQIDGQDFRLVDMISYIAAPTENELLLSTPYLIPKDNPLEDLRDQVEKGVRVHILTNSLASTNHTLVNSHYKKYRRRLLDTGAHLYEFRHQPAADLRARVDVAPVKAPFISLHAKTIVADKRLCFIGSLNFDPRALEINSENGLLIDSPELGEQLATFMLELMNEENAWQLSINKKNRIEWNSSKGRLDAQPARGVMQSFTDLLGPLLPIEGQL